MEFSKRISTVKPYFFSKLGKKIVAMRANGVDVIRLDMGSPDLPPANHIINALKESASRSDTHGYTLGSGTHIFRSAIADHYQRRFGVSLDPTTEVVDLIGSKEGLFGINQILLNPGDISLVPDPGYGVYSAGALVAGAEVIKLPLLQENNYLVDFTNIPAAVYEKAKLLWLNYPNNPTGAVASREFFQTAVDYGRENNILIAHDAPYVDVGFDGYKAPSILEIDGAKDVAVEFNSLSKAYNMAGWRLGMAVGNPEVIKHLELYKGQQDSAHFAPILAAGVSALDGEQDWIEERNAIYQERRDAVLDSLNTCGIIADTPNAALYVWAKIPAGQTSVEFCERMLDEIGVSTTPGSVFGQHGEGFLRVSLVSPVEDMQRGLDKIVEWMNETVAA